MDVINLPPINISAGDSRLTFGDGIIFKDYKVRSHHWGIFKKIEGSRD